MNAQNLAIVLSPNLSPQPRPQIQSNISQKEALKVNTNYISISFIFNFD